MHDHTPHPTVDTASSLQHDVALLADVSRWLELRMAACAPGLASLLVELGRLDATQPVHELAAGAATHWRTRWACEPTQLRALCERLGLDDVLDATLLLALWGLSEQHELEVLRRQAFNDDAFFPLQLVLRLCSDDPQQRARLMARLEPGAPLRALQLVHLVAPASRPHSALRHHLVELDEAVLARIEGRNSWPAQLDDCVVVSAPHEPIGQGYFADKLERLDRACSAPLRPGEAHVVALCSATAATAAALAHAWAARDGRPLFVVDAPRAMRSEHRLEALLGILLREARMRDAVVLVGLGRDEARLDDDAMQRLLSALARLAPMLGAPLLVDTPRRGDERLRAHLGGLYEVRTLPPTLEEQVDIWQEALASAGIAPLPPRVLRQHVCDLALEVGDIHRAARLAANNAWLAPEPAGDGDGGGGGDGSGGAPLEVDAAHLRAMVASRLNQGMNGVAERITTTLTWSDLVLPARVVEGLMDVITYARYQRQVFEEWGFGAKMPYGRANSCLFGGPPGTGKTMAAGVIARELGMDLFRVDLSQVLSKWIGETEKNLARVFDEASRGHAVLLFDEADSLFGKRTEVKSSNDRYNNLQVNYLLQRMESFEGITILTSNLAASLDEAFLRRIKFKLEFPVPDAGDRARLWQVMVPRDASREPVIDFAHLGEAFEMAGGHIKNAVLRAAFRAAESGVPMSTVLLEQAGIAELREMGKLVRVDEHDRLVVPDPPHAMRVVAA